APFARSPKRCARMSNTVSRRRSEVGRIAGVVGAASGRPRSSPATIRIALASRLPRRAAARAFAGALEAQRITRGGRGRPRRRPALPAPLRDVEVCSRLLREALAKLVAQDLARHFADRSGRKVAELEGAERNADEAGHGEAEMLH